MLLTNLKYPPVRIECNRVSKGKYLVLRYDQEMGFLEKTKEGWNSRKHKKREGKIFDSFKVALLFLTRERNLIYSSYFRGEVEQWDINTSCGWRTCLISDEGYVSITYPLEDLTKGKKRETSNIKQILVRLSKMDQDKQNKSFLTVYVESLNKKEREELRVILDKKLEL